MGWGRIKARMTLHGSQYGKMTRDGDPRILGTHIKQDRMWNV